MRCFAQVIRGVPDMQQTKECVSGLLTLALSMGFLSSPSERYGPGCQHNDAIAKSGVNCKYFADHQNHKILFLFMSPLISQL